MVIGGSGFWNGEMVKRRGARFRFAFFGVAVRVGVSNSLLLGSLLTLFTF